MKKVTAKANQTIYDVAIEQYGTCEAVGKLMQDNPGMENDLQAVTEAGIEKATEVSILIYRYLRVARCLSIRTAG